MHIDDRKAARTRALRAARVVTLGLAMAAVPACGSSHVAGGDSGSVEGDGGPGPVDAAIELVDAGGPAEDAARPIDAAPPDSGIGPDAGTQEDAAVADAGPLVCPPVFPPTTKECCEATPGGYWDMATNMCYVAVPGPFVPPSESAHV